METINNSYSNRVNKVNHNSNSNRRQLTPREADEVIKEVADLIDPNYEKWFYKVLNRTGKQWFLERAKLAREEGRDKKKYFCYLLKGY